MSGGSLFIFGLWCCEVIGVCDLFSFLALWPKVQDANHEEEDPLHLVHDVDQSCGWLSLRIQTQRSRKENLDQKKQLFQELLDHLGFHLLLMVRA